GGAVRRVPTRRCAELRRGRGRREAAQTATRAREGKAAVAADRSLVQRQRRVLGVGEAAGKRLAGRQRRLDRVVATVVGVGAAVREAHALAGADPVAGRPRADDPGQIPTRLTALGHVLGAEIGGSDVDRARATRARQGRDRRKAAQTATRAREGKAAVAADRSLVQRQRRVLGVGEAAGKRLAGRQRRLDRVVATVVGVGAAVREAHALAGADPVAGRPRADDPGQIPTRLTALGHVLGAEIGGSDVDRARATRARQGRDRRKAAQTATRAREGKAAVAADRSLVQRQRRVLGVGEAAGKRLAGRQRRLDRVVATVVGVGAAVREAHALAGADPVAGRPRADDPGQIPTRLTALGHVLGAEIGGSDVDRARATRARQGRDRRKAAQTATRAREGKAAVAADRSLVQRQRRVLGVGEAAGKRLAGRQRRLDRVVATVVGVGAAVREAHALAGADPVAGRPRADDPGQIPTRLTALGHVLGAEIGGSDVDRARATRARQGRDRRKAAQTATRAREGKAAVAADRSLVQRQRRVLGVGEAAGKRLAGRQRRLDRVVATVVGVGAAVREAHALAGADPVAGRPRADDPGQIPTRLTALRHVLGAEIGGSDVDRARATRARQGRDR